MGNSRRIWAVFCLLVTALGWGIMYPASKQAASSGIDGYYLALFRYVPGSILMCMILFFSEGIKSFSFEGKAFKLWIFGTIGFAGLNLLTFVGISLSSAEHATIILATMPVMSLLVSMVSEKIFPEKSSVLFSFLSFFGIFLVITGGNISTIISSSLHVLIGDILLLAATICWVIYTYFARSILNWSAIRITALSSALGTCSIAVIVFLCTIFGVAHPPSIHVIYTCNIDLFILVITTTLIVTWNAGIKGIGAVNGILFVNLVPITTLIIGFYQGHLITRIEILGTSITLLSVISNNLISRFSTRPAYNSKKRI